MRDNNVRAADQRIPLQLRQPVSVHFKARYKTVASILKDKVKFPRSSLLSKEARHLIKCMLQKDYMFRYSVEDIKIHPWIAGEFKDDYQE